MGEYHVVAQCATNYGVIDTDDNIVNWVTKGTLVDYVEGGVDINGVTVDSDAERAYNEDGDETEVSKASRCTVVVNPLYYVPYENTQFGHEDIIFNIYARANRGFQKFVELSVEDENNSRPDNKFIKYKIRPLKRVVTNATISLGGYSFVADRDGILCKMSNGVCTILSDEQFDAVFDGKPTAESVN